MSKRAKPYPWFLVTLCGLLILYGVVAAARGAGVIGGFAIGFGVASAISATFVWASPINARITPAGRSSLNGEEGNG